MTDRFLDIAQVVRATDTIEQLQSCQWPWFVDICFRGGSEISYPLMGFRKRDSATGSGPWLDCAIAKQVCLFREKYQKWVEQLKTLPVSMLNETDRLLHQNKLQPVYMFLSDDSVAHTSFQDAAPFLVRVAPSASHLATYRVALQSEPLQPYYPYEPLLLGLPVAVREGQHTRVLATIIVIAEYDGTPDQAKAIHQWCVGATVQLGAVLRTWYSQEIAGIYASADPVLALAHPALTRPEYRKVARFEGRTHDNMGEPCFMVPKPDPDNELKERLFVRSVATITIPDEGGSDSLKQALTWRSGSMADPDLRSKAHSWLKALYAFHLQEDGGYRTPGADYAPDAAWILALLDAAIPQGDGTTEYVTLHRRLTASNHVRFRFPVLPGLRVVVPWLSLIRDLVEQYVEWKKGSKNPDDKQGSATEKLTVTNVIVNSGILWPPNNEEKARAELSGRIGLAMDLKFAGAASADYEEWLRRARGWRRALMNPGKRRGGDTRRFTRVVTCDALDVLRSAGLNVGEDGPEYLGPIHESPVDLDILDFPQEQRLLLAATWQAPGQVGTSGPLEGNVSVIVLDVSEPERANHIGDLLVEAGAECIVVTSKKGDNGWTEVQSFTSLPSGCKAYSTKQYDGKQSFDLALWHTSDAALEPLSGMAQIVIRYSGGGHPEGKRYSVPFPVQVDSLTRQDAASLVAWLRGPPLVTGEERSAADAWAAVLVLCDLFSHSGRTFGSSDWRNIVEQVFPERGGGSLEGAIDLLRRQGGNIGIDELRSRALTALGQSRS